LEARYHHHAAGQADQAVAATWQAVGQRQTWGQYGRAAGLCRDTLTWLPFYSQRAAAFEGALGDLAQRRGDYDTAEHSHRRALETFTRLGDQKNMAAGYHNLGMLAQRRGDYDEAARQYQRALGICERIGDQKNMAVGYHNLSALAQRRGDYDEAARQYQRALDIKER
jgi:tetratricopeptide (TPR) repeat protein